MKVQIFGRFVALFSLLTLVTTEIIHAPKKLGEFIKIDSPKEAKESTKFDVSREVEEPIEVNDGSLKEKSSVSKFCSTCVKLGNTCYNRSYLFELTAPFRSEVVIKKMGILRSKNILYYSFEPTIDDPEYFKIAYVSLDSSVSVRTHYIRGKESYNFGVFDINQRNNEIYLGGSDGIWIVKQLNKRTPDLTFYAAKGSEITNVISKDYVYFTKEYRQGIIKLEEGRYNYLLDDTTIENFVMDKDVDSNVVYINATGLFAFNNKTSEEVRLSKNPFFRGLTVDLYGTVYAWYIDGIYKVFFNKEYSHSNLTRVTNVEVGAMAFDGKNDIIYSKDKSLFKLTNLLTSDC